jgi:hypothetical protein
MTQLKLPEFTHITVSIKGVTVQGEYDANKHFHVDHLRIENKRVKPTRRFWDSLCSRFGIGPSIFKYFSHEEVFNRVSDLSDKDSIRITVQETPSLYEQAEVFCAKALAISSPATKSLLHNDELLKTLAELGALHLDYHNGIITTHHKCRNEMAWKIGNDEYETRISLETPVDGYGKPLIHLATFEPGSKSLNRVISKTFQSGIILGNDRAAAFTLRRAVESFSNEDGFVALKQRFESAQNSWASIWEAVKLSKFLYTFDNEDFREDFAKTIHPLGLQAPEGTLRNHLLKGLHDRTGDIRTIYSLAQIDSLNEKRMRMLPTRCKVYGLLTLVARIATHQVTPEAGRQLHTYVGDLVSHEYDLENSCSRFGEFDDFIDKSSSKRFKPKGSSDE